jgi:hypothetical protein
VTGEGEPHSAIVTVDSPSPVTTGEGAGG